MCRDPGKKLPCLKVTLKCPQDKGKRIKICTRPLESKPTLRHFATEALEMTRRIYLCRLRHWIMRDSSWRMKNRIVFFFERMSADRREDLPMKMHVELAHCRTTDGCGTLRRVNAYPAACRLIRSCLSDRMNRRMAPGIASKSDPWPLDKLCSKPIYLGANVQGKFLGDLPAYLVTKCTEFHF